MPEYKALSAAKKEKMIKAATVLKDKGFDITSYIGKGLKKQHELLCKAVGAMNCPEGGIFVKNADVLKACDVSRKSCEGAASRLVAAQTLLTAMPGVVETKTAGKTECPEAAKTCPESAKTKINN